MQHQEQIESEITNVAESPKAGLLDPSRITKHRVAEILRHPIAAGKDPRLSRLKPHNTNPDHILNVKFAAIMNTLFPHNWVEDALYLDIAGQALLSPEIAEIVSRASARMEAILGESLLSATPLRRSEALRRMEGEPAFRALLGAAIRYFYDDPRIWSGCGYEGVHGCRGGEQRAGIADADWLPDVEDGQ